MKRQISQVICPNCNSKSAIKRGKRKRKLREIQQFQCKNCQTFFSPQSQDNKTYPISIILKAISIYNIGYNLKQTSEKVEKRNKIKIPISTISNWLQEYSSICTFSKLRKEAKKLYPPKEIIFSQRLEHNQIYNFQLHKAELGLLFSNTKLQ